MLVTKTLADLQSVLLEAPDNLLDEAYFVIRDNKLLRGPEPNITIIPSCQIGREYPKTFGHYHKHGEPETYRILFGQAGLLIQKPDKDDYGKVKDVKLLKGKIGDHLEVPPAYGHCLINLGKEVLITADWESQSAGHLYEEIKKLHGLCYYIIREDGKLKAIRNKNYKSVPDLKLV